jgi:hypothetical protein
MSRKCACKHLWKRHDAGGCHANYSAGPSGVFRCPCRVPAPERSSTATSSPRTSSPNDGGSSGRIG